MNISDRKFFLLALAVAAILIGLTLASCSSSEDSEDANTTGLIPTKCQSNTVNPLDKELSFDEPLSV
ncbi:MAG: hypothetical protein GY780_03200 [bacterium]|nr:hypothetical protein [bacterium]